MTGWMAVAAGLGLIVYLSALRPAHRRGMFGRTRGHTIWMLLVVAMLASVQMRYHLIKFHRTATSLRPGALVPPVLRLHAAKPPSPGGVHLPWPVLIALAITGVVAGLALVSGPGRLRRRGRTDALSDDNEAAVVAQIVAEAAWTALDDLAEEADPRRAVIAAYARMERGLRQAGIRRAPADTPSEYLTRAFARLPAATAEAARLTELYEEARFSDHTVAETMRADAISALGSLARALEEWRVTAESKAKAEAGTA